MVQYEQKNLDDIISITRTTRTIKGFENKRLLIRRIQRHTVTQFSAANGNKQISQVRRTICKITLNNKDAVSVLRIR
jgi:hypothetical protein